jgi:hypothetical protein
MEFGKNQLYVVARRALLDALDALIEQRDAVILVGAQAVYLRSGTADLQVALYTKDADLGIDPTRLSANPHLEKAMVDAGFTLSLDRADGQPGTWLRDMRSGDGTITVPVDLPPFSWRRRTRSRTGWRIPSLTVSERRMPPTSSG